jgi:hypothetical protein
VHEVAPSLAKQEIRLRSVVSEGRMALHGTRGRHSERTWNGTHSMTRLRGQGDCWELKPFARNRAISLPDNPTGTGVPGCGSGNAVGDVGDRRWRANISAFGFAVHRVKHLFAVF